MKKNLSFKTVGTILFVAAGMFFIFQGCQKDDYFDREKIDQTIATSPELEEYVIAASDFQHSLNAFAHEMNKVDFSNLEIVQDSAGNYVTYLPGIIRSLRVEEKAQIMNEKKKALLRKYPQLASWNFSEANNYVNYSTDQSVKVNSKFLELGFNKYMALTKSGTTEMFGTLGEVMAYIADWMTRPDYVEAYIVIYYDGTKEVFVDDRNTATESYLPITNDNGNITRKGKRVQWIAHTHQESAKPGDADKAMAAKYPGLTQGIYYDGAFNWYNIAE